MKTGNIKVNVTCMHSFFFYNKLDISCLKFTTGNVVTLQITTGIVQSDGHYSKINPNREKRDAM